MEAKNPVGEKPGYWSPYLAGLAIGLTLILTYYVMGHGVGASGAYTQLAARMLQAEAPRHAAKNVYLSSNWGRFFIAGWSLKCLGYCLEVFLARLLQDGSTLKSSAVQRSEK